MGTFQASGAAADSANYTGVFEATRSGQAIHEPEGADVEGAL
jgi:hypothetical protein